MGHLFLALRKMPPAGKKLGRVINNSLRVAEGELATNNVFGRPNECHAHYYDMREAYARTNHTDFISRFEAEEREYSLHKAAARSPLWSPAMRHYATVVEKVTRDPLTSFVIALVSEDTIQRGYQKIVKYLQQELSFDAYRTFLERHITLDQGEHGPATVEWLEMYFEHHQPSRWEVNRAIKNTIKFVQARIRTYEL